MTVTLSRFSWPLLSDGQAGPSVEVGQVDFDQAGAHVTLHLYQMAVSDLWDLASWARLSEGTVQPLTVADEAELSRWWLVDKIGIDGGSVKANGQVRLTLSLGVIRDGGRPIVESFLHGAAREVGNPSAPAGNAIPWHAVPLSASFGYMIANAADVALGVTIDTAHGQIYRFQPQVPADFWHGSSTRRPAVVAYPLVPSDAYVGGVRIEAKVGGQWRTVHGLELPTGVGWEDVRIANGLCQLGGDSGSSAWVAGWPGLLGGYGPHVGLTYFSNATVAQVAIRQNSAHTCSLLVTRGALGFRSALSVVLRRGSRLPVFSEVLSTPQAVALVLSNVTGGATHLTRATTKPAHEGGGVLSWVKGAYVSSSLGEIRWEPDGTTFVDKTGAFTGGQLPPGVTDRQAEVDMWHAQMTERVKVPR